MRFCNTDPATGGPGCPLKRSYEEIVNVAGPVVPGYKISRSESLLNVLQEEGEHRSKEEGGCADRVRAAAIQPSCGCRIMQRARWSRGRIYAPDFGMCPHHIAKASMFKGPRELGTGASAPN